MPCARATVFAYGLWEPGRRQGTLIQRFFDSIEKFTPQLVSWNGGGFDLPVLHYRSLIHGVQCARYWDMGEDDKDFKWNNYISRYHARHLDLMDLLALYTARANAPLDELARLIGFPGKLGMDGGKVWEAYQQGRLNEIRSYCETDVVNTYLVYARFQLMRGQLTPARYRQECDLVPAAGQTSNPLVEYLPAGHSRAGFARNWLILLTAGMHVSFSSINGWLRATMFC